MKRLAALVLLLFIGSVAYSTPKINPSGVWSWSGLKMTSVAEFSWGVNPRSIESEIIDLNADPAYIVVSSEKFIVTSGQQQNRHRRRGLELVFQNSGERSADAGNRGQR